MNIQSIIILIVVLACFVWAIVHIRRKPTHCDGCSACDRCGDTHCQLRNKKK